MWQLFFPKLCLHCNEPYKSKNKLFCLSCASLLHMANAKMNTKSERFEKIAFAFENNPIAYQLSKEVFKYPSWKKILVSYLFLQFARQNFGKPDLIVPSSKNTIVLSLAKGMSKLLKCPYKKYRLSSIINKTILVIGLYEEDRLSVNPSNQINGLFFYK